MEDKKKILLIDDETDFCFFVKENLEQMGIFEVITTTSGAEGIRLAKRIKPDLVLVDILMPNVGGPEVVENLMNDQVTKNVPVVFLTAVVSKAEIGAELIKEIGGQHFIAKPVDTDALARIIKNVLGAHMNA